MTGMVARLDGYGRAGWLAAMIMGFVLFWPIGLLILGYMIWGGRMGCRNDGRWAERQQAYLDMKIERMQERMDRWSLFRQRIMGQTTAASASFAPSGNRAFDEYRSETIQRLEREATEFRDFLDRLRHAKDKAEFEQFMADRKGRPAEPNSEDKSTN
ncbi:Protein of unknown function DUF2852 [Rhabdaerophilaceae bacterium]